MRTAPAAWPVLALLLLGGVVACSASMRQFEHAPPAAATGAAVAAETSSSTKPGSTTGSSSSSSISGASAAQAAAAASAHQPRRMMEAPAQPLANTRIPTAAAARFTKLGREAASKQPLGTAVNGSQWQPGACGNTPSSLGYQCSWTAPSGLVLHWTYTQGGSSAPPINRCTMQPQAVPNLEIQEATSDSVVHLALQASSGQQEQLHLAFLDGEARPFPSEGVHSTSTSQVQVLFQSAPGESTVTGRLSSRTPDLFEGWAGWVAADSGGSTQILCLSRHVNTKLMKLVPQQSTDLLLAYAASSSPNYIAHAQRNGIVSLGLHEGKAYVVTSPTGYLLAHGALMLIAFGVLLPCGLLLARHKWLFVDEELGLSPFWALSHLCVLLAAALTALVGMIVALVRFGNSVDAMVMSTHQVLGLLSVAMSLVLVVMYGLRPFIRGPHKHSPSPLLGPLKVGGCITVCAGWTSLFLGCVVIHRNWGVPHFVWLVPCVLLTALVAAAATLLELRYQKMLRSGEYNPKTATRFNVSTSIMPMARIRTHREPTDLKKHEAPSSGGGGKGAALDDGQPGSAGISGGAAMVAATMLARSMHGHHSPRTQQHHSDAGFAGTAGALGITVRTSSSSGGSGELLWRRGRHSTPNGPSAAPGQTGFPSSPDTQLRSDGVL